MNYFSWQTLAVASVFFAATTAVLAMIGVSQINNDLVTFVRSIDIMLLMALILTVRHKCPKP